MLRFRARPTDNQKASRRKTRTDRRRCFQKIFETFRSNQSADYRDHRSASINLEFRPDRKIIPVIGFARDRDAIGNHVNIVAAQPLFQKPFAGGAAVRAWVVL